MARGGNPPLPHSAFCCVPASHNGPHYANGCQLGVRKMRKVPHFSAISRRAPPAQNRLSGAHSTADSSAPAHRAAPTPAPTRRIAVPRHRLNSEPPNDASTEITSPSASRSTAAAIGGDGRSAKRQRRRQAEQHAVPKALGIRIKQRQQAFALLTRSAGHHEQQPCAPAVSARPKIPAAAAARRAGRNRPGKNGVRMASTIVPCQQNKDYGYRWRRRREFQCVGLRSS